MPDWRSICATLNASKHTKMPRLRRKRNTRKVIYQTSSGRFVCIHHMILHSGEYWNMMRRRKKEREARAAQASSSPSDGGAVFTLLPPKGARKPVPVVTTNSILASRARDDEILLARFKASQEQSLKRKAPASGSKRLSRTVPGGPIRKVGGVKRGR
ncbi:hypothetical protein C8R43DRAFT_1115553 [Mycena crocata]|nr:hypothetical protein C8R43DRAFT_1115553 [Mycena crocata]